MLNKTQCNCYSMHTVFHLINFRDLKANLSSKTKKKDHIHDMYMYKNTADSSYMKTIATGTCV